MYGISMLSSEVLCVDFCHCSIGKLVGCRNNSSVEIVFGFFFPPKACKVIKKSYTNVNCRHGFHHCVPLYFDICNYLGLCRQIKSISYKEPNVFAINYKKSPTNPKIPFPFKLFLLLERKSLQSFGASQGVHGQGWWCTVTAGW